MRKHKQALIAGCGSSGQAAQALLRAEGTETICISRETTPDYRYESLGFTPDVAVISPGFSLEHPWILDLIRRGIPLLSELELGWSRRRCPVVAVTGSNGKSTAVKWIAETLTRAGQPALPCGNYGLPVCSAVMGPNVPAWLVVEVSSFQLETVQAFRPEIGLLLNVLPNHLDRHKTMEVYRGLKFRIFDSMCAADTAILPAGLLGLFRDRRPAFPGRCMTFGTEPAADLRYFAGRAASMDLAGTPFDNEILGVAAAAVAGVCGLCGVSPETAAAAARAFEPLPHRTAPVAVLDGVRYVDDSKATNLAAMCAAVKMCSGPVHLIAGGRSKESDFSFAKDLLAQRVSHLYLIGEASDAMQAAWGDAVRCVPCGTLRRAVEAASRQAGPGETVLLSPACTSFDQFRDFNERGDCFAAAVRSLSGPRAEEKEGYGEEKQRGSFT